MKKVIEIIKKTRIVNIVNIFLYMSSPLKMNITLIIYKITINSNQFLNIYQNEL